MGKIAEMAALSCALLACTSVKMVQREGCWVKQTERTLGGTTEELGFCSKQRPEWAEDRRFLSIRGCWSLMTQTPLTLPRSRSRPGSLPATY